MRVIGTIKDAVKEKILANAKVSLYVGEKELAVLYSDEEGRFEHKETVQYIGEILICRVEKEGFEPQKVTYKIEHDEVPLEIELVSKEKEELQLNISLKDEKRNSLKGVKITLDLEIVGDQVGSGISDKCGNSKIMLKPDLEGKTVLYRVELGGFELTTGRIQLKKETFHEITMSKIPEEPPPPHRKWPNIIAFIIGTILIIFGCILLGGRRTGETGVVFIIMGIIIIITTIVITFKSKSKPRKIKSQKVESVSMIGTIIEKSFRPPPGSPVEYWCYLIVEEETGERIKIRLHKKQIDSVAIGDRIRFIKPRRTNKTIKVELVERGRV